MKRVFAVILFLLIYFYFEGFLIPYLIGFGGRIGFWSDIIHYFPFDFGYYYGPYAIASLVLNGIFWTLIWYLIFSYWWKTIRARKKKVKNETLDG